MLAIEIDTVWVIRVLEQLKQTRGLPTYLRVDNGSGLASHLLKEWTQANRVNLLYFQPNKPAQNAY